MAEHRGAALTKGQDDAEKFHERLDHYEDSALRMIYEYYRDDLIYIVESLNTRRFLSELKLWTKFKLERYLSRNEDLSDSILAETLVQDILEAGREAVIEFWKCLYGLKANHPHPNLLAVLDEIIQRGDRLKLQILLDEFGYPIPELKDIQGKHKLHLLEKTQYLVEHRPPRSTKEQQSFYITERYVNMIVLSPDHFRQRSQHELIETGRNHEDIMRKESLMLEHIALNKLFRWSRQKRCVPSVVMVSGVPGIGKTTMMQKFVYDWVTGKLYQRFAFVFFFKFRELNRLDEVSLETMILQQYPYLQGQLGKILEDPEKLLFIFDGLDESIHSIDFNSDPLCSNPQWTECSSVIVVNLVRKSLLKGCSVLITSRPTKLTLTDSGAFQRITEIMGFFPKERQMYFDMFFHNKELSERAFHYVRENDTLYTFCYIPSYCWIVCTVLSMCFKSQPTTTDQLMSSLPKTVTQLFVTFVSNILSNHNQDKRGAREQMTSFGWMAEHGVMNHILAFDERDLGSFNVDTSSHLTSCFMMESGHSPNVIFSFLHLTLQEFLAALVHYLDYSPEKLHSSINTAEPYTDGQAEILLRFLCGFLDSSTRSILKCLGDFSIIALKDVTSWLHKSLVCVQKDENIDMGKFLNLFACLFESQNTTLVEECLGPNRTFTFHSVSHLTPVDCSALAFVLKSCRETEQLELLRCNIQTECWERLTPVLHTIKHINLTTTGLKDSHIHFIASALNHHKCRIQHLILTNNALTDSCCSEMASAIETNQSLRILNMSFNRLGGPYFFELVTALSSPTCKIQELLLLQRNIKKIIRCEVFRIVSGQTVSLNSNMLTANSCSQMAPEIGKNQSLRKVDLSHNNLDGSHFYFFATALSSTKCRIEELLLRGTGLTETSCSNLASAISKNRSLRKLDLADNNLNGPHFHDLMTALSSPTCRIEELLLSYAGLTNTSCSNLASAICKSRSLRNLDLSGNNLAGPQFSDLITALCSPACQIEELLLRQTGLTDSSCCILAPAVSKKQSLRRLNLSSNQLAGPHFSDLMTALSSPTCQIEDLNLRETWLTDEEAPLLVSLSNNTNLTYLDLSYNYFQDRGYNVIKELKQRSTSLKEIRLLDIGWSQKQKDDLMEMERSDLNILVKTP